MDLHFQYHDYVRLALEGIYALHELRVVEAVHDADLLPHVLLLFLRKSFDELPCPHLFGRLLNNLEDLTKFTPEMRERGRNDKKSEGSVSEIDSDQ